MMRVAIVGSRDYPNLSSVREFVASLPPDVVVVTGGARGVDTEAALAAVARGMSVSVYPAQWERYGKRAGYLRNKQIVEDVGSVVAFWDGKSKGTKHTIDLAKELGKPIHIFGVS